MFFDHVIRFVRPFVALQIVAGPHLVLVLQIVSGHHLVLVPHVVSGPQLIIVYFYFHLMTV